MGRREWVARGKKKLLAREGGAETGPSERWARRAGENGVLVRGVSGDGPSRRGVWADAGKGRGVWAGLGGLPGWVWFGF